MVMPSSKELQLSRPDEVFVQDDDSVFIQLFPYPLHINGQFSLDERTEEKWAEVGTLDAGEGTTMDAIGSRLIELFLIASAKEDVDLIEVSTTNPAQLEIWGKVVGEEALHFYEDYDDKKEELPLTAEQARQSIEHYQAKTGRRDALTPVIRMSEIAGMVGGLEAPGTPWN